MDAELASKVLKTYTRDFKRFKNLPASVGTSMLLSVFDPDIQLEIKEQVDQEQLNIPTSADGKYSILHSLSKIQIKVTFNSQF